ncbi:hypothetical protein YWS52_38700 [Chitiniphilus shinanonensis]
MSWPLLFRVVMNRAGGEGLLRVGSVLGGQGRGVVGGDAAIGLEGERLGGFAGNRDPLQLAVGAVAVVEGGAVGLGQAGE